MNIRLKNFALLAPLLFSVFLANAKVELVYIASSTQGIVPCRLDLESGALTTNGGSAKMARASFLAIAPDHRSLYAVGEGGAKDSVVAAFSIDAKTGQLVALNQSPSGGSGPCHVSVDNAGRHLFVANYGNGSVASFNLAKDGSLESMGNVVQHHGESITPKRQAGPHAHCVIPEGSNHVFACDLGIDEILIYDVDATTGKLLAGDPSFAKTKPGAGPRHLAFSPDSHWAYVVNELDSTLTVFENTKIGELKAIQSLSTVPADFKRKNYPAEVAVSSSGKFVYASNRGHDSIGVYAVDAKNGQVKLVEYCPAQGKNPRHFEIDPSGKFLLCANVDSGNVVVFKIDAETGKLASTGQSMEIKAPMCVKCLAK